MPQVLLGCLLVSPSVIHFQRANERLELPLKGDVPHATIPLGTKHLPAYTSRVRSAGKSGRQADRGR